MINAGGKNFITLMDDFYVNGEKVTAAYMNGIQVYPVMSGTAGADGSGTGTTNFRAVYVHTAYLSVSALCAYIDWGDGKGEAFISDRPYGSSHTFIHEYDDLEFHLVSLTMLTRVDSSDDGYLSITCMREFQGDTNLENFKNWLGPFTTDGPSDVYWQVRDRIVSEYKRVALAWALDGKLNTTLLMSHHSYSEMSAQIGSDGEIYNFHISSKFEYSTIMYANGTIYINGKLVVQG